MPESSSTMYGGGALVGQMRICAVNCPAANAYPGHVRSGRHVIVLSPAAKSRFTSPPTSRKFCSPIDTPFVRKSTVTMAGADSRYATETSPDVSS